ncbi:MAG TPA: hypothetical protein DCK79_07290 [Candidatus Atribacteria bacterium]|nr:hypothetical protein [Candidatus Atribacteria bacterium]
MKYKILVVDDEENIRWVLKESLGDIYNIQIAKNGEDALVKINKEIFDLVLLDLKLPKISGLEILRKIKKEKRNSIVVILTAYGNKENIKMAKELGVYCYLTKPFDLLELKSIIKKALDKK